jgi:hypothetical protein
MDIEEKDSMYENWRTDNPCENDVLSPVSDWRFLAKEQPPSQTKIYEVIDKYGTIESKVIFGCMGAPNEPYSFFDGKVIYASDIIAYR